VQDLLFLAHRIPYPPNKGDKIRSFNLLKHLAGHYRVHLGAFVDDPQDWRHAKTLEAICGGGVKLLALEPRRAKLRSLRGLLTGRALTVPYYEDRRMAQWVEERMSTLRIKRTIVFSSAMAQYVSQFRGAEQRCVVDFVDVDSDKWRQYAKTCRWPMNWLYAREARRLLEFDRDVAAWADASMFVSGAEAELFSRLAPEVAERIAAIENGVDTEYFNPAREYRNPYASDEQAVVFTGAMDYRANVDAVRWFAREVFPTIRTNARRCSLYIVGARPSDDVKRLVELPGVRVTGAVEDIRPYLTHAAFAVAPLRIARGVQNKVLEAMAMGKVVLATPAAVDGLRQPTVLSPWVAGEPSIMAAYAQRLLTETDHEEIGRASREYVLRYYNWSRNLERVITLLETGVSTSSVATADRVIGGQG